MLIKLRIRDDIFNASKVTKVKAVYPIYHSFEKVIRGTHRSNFRLKRSTLSCSDYNIGGPVVQPGRIPALRAGGPGFKSRPVH